MPLPSWVPPTAGFWGKFLILREAFAQGRYLWGGVALAVGLLTFDSMSKIWAEGFWKPHPDPARLAPAAMSAGAWVAVTGLSLVTLALGLHPDPMIRLIDQGTSGFWDLGATP